MQAGGEEYLMNKRGGMMHAREAARAGAPGGDVWVAVGHRLALRREELGYSADRVAEARRA